MSRPIYCRLILPAIFLAALTGVHAQTKVENRVLAAGGGSAANATTSLAGTFGQSIIGLSVDPGLQVSQGFWFSRGSHPLPASTEPIAGESFLQLQCAPNPFSMSATVRASFPHSEQVSIAFHDLFGREVLSIGPIEESSDSATFELNAGELPEGHYVLILTAGTDRTLLPVRIVR